jgi:hypothetical protein
MKTVLLLLCTMLMSGCVPSLCLVNCGTSTTEERTHRWEDWENWENNTTFMQGGTRWFCVVNRTESGLVEPGTSNVRKAICQEKKP